MFTNETANITLLKFPEENLFDFLPKLFGKYFVQGESIVYKVMREQCAEYTGGHWNYYELSNGGLFMALSSEEPVTLKIASNGFSGSMSAIAAGVVVTMYALNYLGNALYETNEDLAQQFFEAQHLLRNYALEHPEHVSILGAID